MRKTKMLILAAVLTAGLTGCAPETEVATTDSPTETPATGTSTDTSVLPGDTAETWVDNPTLGSELNKEGRVAFGFEDNDFVAGDTIYYAMETGDAPADANIRVAWFGPDDAQLHEETRTVDTGSAYIHFETPDTSGWTPGDYRVEVYADDQLAHQEEFRVEAAKQ